MTGVGAEEVHVRESCRERVPLMRGLNSSIPATPVRTACYPLLAQCRLYLRYYAPPPMNARLSIFQWGMSLERGV